MNPGSSTESYPAFARIGLRENLGKNLNQVTCPDRDSNPGHLVSRPDALTVTPQMDETTCRMDCSELEQDTVYRMSHVLFQTIAGNVFGGNKGLATQGSVRRIDIIAIKNNWAYIFDPIIRFEAHADQPHEVDSEKKRIYEPTIPFYKDKYSLPHIDVIGLMVGARSIIPSFFANKCKNLGLTHSTVKEIAISALTGSVQILRNHLYGSDNGNFNLS
ncbi:hypothetical protein ANN_01305 [Periplaneta americana]|uniref:Uncharacterized protein n=1 Tax=Periplaneta americana TaxID=6978 RepID=A0ABQ8TWK9_PERAM|nr:hypothetical protein ANN_01305 [Periplaneta americana]